MYCQELILFFAIILCEVTGTMKTYVERIRELREDHDLKQQDIAKLLETTQQVYSRYEHGINEIPLRHIITLSDFYNVSCDYILGQTDNKERR